MNPRESGDPQFHDQVDDIAGTYGKAAAASLAASLLENSSDLIAAFDSAYRFIALNTTFCREFELVFGKSVKIGQPFDDALVHLTNDRDRATALCRRALAGESFCVVEDFGDEQLLRKSYELSFSPIRARNHPMFAGVVVRDITLQRLSDHRFGALLEAAPDATIIIRPDGVIDSANEHAGRMFGYSRLQLLGMPVEKLLPERFRRQHVAHRQGFAKNPATRPMGSGRADLWGLRADGTEFPVEISLNPLDVAGEKMVVGAIRDMTIRKFGEDQLRELSVELEQRVAERTVALEQANKDFRATFEQAAVGIAHVGTDLRWLRVNQTLCDMLGYPRQTLLELTFQDITHPDDLHADLALLQRLRDGEIGSYAIEKRYRHKSGDIIWISLNVSLVRDNQGAPEYFILVVKDIRDRKQAEERIRQMALHDPLTGLPNRALLFECARRMFASAQRARRHCAVLFIDLDRFKLINDTHGHETGDEILKEVAHRLRHCTRSADMVFRLGGDEFMVLLSEIDHDADAGEVARHIASGMNRSYQVNGLELSLSSSIGIGIYPRDGEDINILMNNADAAMYQAKQAGRNNYQFYSHELAAYSHRQSMIEEQLKIALNHDEFRLYYQPLIDINTSSLIGVEALLRWPHDEVGPDRFVPIAEATGLIDRLGEWVISEACRQHNLWKDHGLPAIPVAVNVSAVQFRQKDFAARFAQAMRDGQVDMSALQLELTETSLMDDIDHAVNVLAQLQALGIKISLDDFGTGYSSLSYLSRLPIDKIKVDKSFVSRIEDDMASRAITEAIIALGRTLNLEIVAEGIESDDVMHYLRLHGCNQAQGFHVCAPVSADNFESWYRHQYRAPVH